MDFEPGEKLYLKTIKGYGGAYVPCSLEADWDEDPASPKLEVICVRKPASSPFILVELSPSVGYGWAGEDNCAESGLDPKKIYWYTHPSNLEKMVVAQLNRFPLGMACMECADHNNMAEPNFGDRYVCRRCRQSSPWKYVVLPVR